MRHIPPNVLLQVGKWGGEDMSWWGFFFFILTVFKNDKQGFPFHMSSEALLSPHLHQCGDELFFTPLWLAFLSSFPFLFPSPVSSTSLHSPCFFLFPPWHIPHLIRIPSFPHPSPLVLMLWCLDHSSTLYMTYNPTHPRYFFSPGKF